MTRLCTLALAAAILGTAPAPAADTPPAGAYRLALDVGPGQSLIFLLQFQSQNGQWAGKFLVASADFAAAPTVENVRVNGDRMRFAIKLGRQELNFDGRVPAAAGPIRGSITLDGNLLLTALEPSNVTKPDRFELLKEVAATAEAGPTFFESTLELLQQAGTHKAAPEEVRAWAEKAVQRAGPYGARWQELTALRVVQALADQPEYTAVALTQARRAERLLDPSDELAVQMPVLEALARLLEKSNKADEAKEVLARITKLEERDYQEYTKSFPFKPDAFAGRKGSSDRAVLVELFTGAECPPCVAADLAFDGLGQAYKPSEVVRLQYHIHIPGPDPLTSPAALTRAAYYRVMDKGTPVTFFNGKEAAGGGGLNPAAARTKFGQYKAAIDPQLETPPAARLRVTARRDGDNLSVNAAVSDLARPGDKVRLRLALAEETVRYRGGNGIRYHHCVVRGFVGPAEGFALAQRSGEHRAGVNLADLRSVLNGYLDKFLKEKENEGVTFAERPLNLRNLHVVAFVQDDATQEVLQAQRAEVK